MWRFFLNRVSGAAAAVAAAASGVLAVPQLLDDDSSTTTTTPRSPVYISPVPSTDNATATTTTANLRACPQPYRPGARWDFNWDAMAGKSPPSGCGGSQQVRRLVLIRHGRYRYRDSDRRLDDLGREQADLLGRRLAELHARHGISRLVSSNVIRAVETAEIALRHLPHLADAREECPLLAEVDPCPPEPPGRGFRPEYVYHRGSASAEAGFRRHIHRAGPGQPPDSGLEVLVCHANVIRYFVCRALQLPPEAWLRFSLDHCSITWLDVYPDGYVCLRSYSDSGYLPNRCVTSSNSP